MRTPLSYYGGKQMLASQIVAMMPEHRVYLEPFAGGAAVLFAKSRAKRETINDLDSRVMRFWRALRERPDELAAAVSLTPYSRAEWQASSDVDVDDDVEAARRLLLNVDQSFSRGRKSWSPPSMLRDRRGRWQPGTWANLPAKILAAAERLSGVCLECGDALEMIPRWDQPGGVIYIDPPYVGEHRLNTKDHCYTHDAGPDLWPSLVDLLLSLERSAVILSGYPCEEAEPLVEAGWRTVSLRATRTVRPRRDVKLGSAPETVWLSPQVPALRLFEEIAG